MTAIGRRRLLVLLLPATLVVVLLDLAGSPWPDRARSLAATALAPVQRAVVAADPGESARLEVENTLLRAQLAQAQTRLAQDEATGRLLSSPSAAGARLLAARVIGSSSTVTGGRQVTIDVGQRDGAAPNLTVVSADGLVGRVVSVGPSSSDVRLLVGSDAAVAVRVGPAGVLGSVSVTTSADVPVRRHGELSLALVDRSTVAVGDRVTTLGSVGGRPYLPGILVGTVIAVDPPRGQLTATAVVTPVVEASRLDVVAVLLAPEAAPAPTTPTAQHIPATVGPVAS